MRTHSQVVRNATETGGWPRIDLTIEHLIDDLSDIDFNQYYPASELLRHYGEQARPLLNADCSGSP